MITLSALNATFLPLMLLAAMIALGAILGRLCELINVPMITGFFLSGILAGLYLLLTDQEDAYDSLKPIGSIALSIIAFELGTRLHFRKVSHNVSEVIIIVLCQAFFTVGLVSLAFYLLGAPWEMGLLIGVIAMATSPETIMVLSRRYRSKGHLTDAIMPHIGMDDMIGIIIFSIALAIASAVNNQTAVSTEVMIFEPLFEIFGSILVGGAIGAILALFIHISGKDVARKHQFYLMETICAIILVTALCQFHYQIGDVEFVFSPILAPMFTGIVFTNLTSKALRKDNDVALDQFTPPFIMIFFALIGIQLVVSIIGLTGSIWFVLLLALIYIIVRIVGKQVGVVVGSKLKKTPKEIVKYLVWSLLPQATVSIGMAQIVLSKTDLPEAWRQILFVVVLIAAFVYQLVGPIVAEKTLIASREIEPGKLNFFSYEHEGKQPEEPRIPRF